MPHQQVGSRRCAVSQPSNRRPSWSRHPGTVDPSEPVQCYGPAATQALTRFAPLGSQVWAVPDVERTDQYDRLLLYLWRAVDGEALFINRALVINGFAIAALYERTTPT